MNKEKEAFDILLQHIETEADWSDYEKVKNAHKTVEEALKRLEAIDNAEPSEALKCLENLCDEFPILKKDYKIIKQALLQYEQDKKELERYKKVETLLKQKDAVIRYFEADDCFGVKTILSDWYKLTDDFLDNNIKEDLKPNPAIQKCKELREELDGYKALEKELGCPLEVFFKVIATKKVYIVLTKCNFNRVYFVNLDFSAQDILTLGFFVGGCKFLFNEYKITWWLKEDKSE